MTAEPRAKGVSGCTHLAQLRCAEARASHQNRCVSSGTGSAASVRRTRTRIANLALVAAAYRGLRARVRDTMPGCRAARRDRCDTTSSSAPDGSSSRGPACGSPASDTAARGHRARSALRMLDRASDMPRVRNLVRRSGTTASARRRRPGDARYTVHDVGVAPLAIARERCVRRARCRRRRRPSINASGPWWLSVRR